MVQTNIDEIAKAGSSSWLLDGIYEAIAGFQMELLLFMVSFWIYSALFGKWSIFAKNKVGRKTAKGGDSEPKSSAKKSSQAKVRAPPGLSSPTANRRHTLGRMSPLAKAIEGLVRGGSDIATLAQEINNKLGECMPGSALEDLADMLESFGRVAGEDLVLAVRQVLTERGLKFDARLGEIFLRIYFDKRLSDAFQKLFAEAEAAGYANSPGIGLLGLKAALHARDLKLSMERFRIICYLWQDNTPSAAPLLMLQQLARLAIEQGAFSSVLEELASITITADALSAMMEECIAKHDSASLQAVVKLARSRRVPFSAGIYCTLLKGASSVEEALRLLKEATQLGVTNKDVLVGAMTFATDHQANQVAEAVLKQLPSNPPASLGAALVNFHAKSTSEGSDAALLKLVDKHLRGVDLSVDTQASRSVLDAALRQQRGDVVNRIVAAASDTAGQVALIKSFASSQSLAEATSIFNACPTKEACHYNALLDVCISCRDFEAAERIMADATKSGLADVATFNTMVKAHLQSGSLRRARSVMAKMRTLGLQPNCVTFNELLDLAIKSSLEDARALVDEMRACGIKPNHITGSILLKGIQPSSKHVEVERIMAIINELEDEMDEVLLSSVVDACIRVGRGDLLMPLLKKQKSTKRLQVRGVHTYGSMIRAYGYVQDIEGVWDAWRDMRRRHINPTSITLGCMVEALVTNGDVEGGYEFIKEVQKDLEIKSLLNAVIFCSVLKGFSHQKRFEQMWAVYKEMLDLQLDFSIVTFNTLVDACARNDEMSKIPGLLQDMVKQGIEPNLITYSAILKGYCKENRLEKALELLETMRQTTQYKPDEIMFNTLLDGCARVGLTDRGMELLEEMQEIGIKPSNFTLSVLVKLASRGRQLDRAFELCEEISKKYRFRLNVHVYSNLVQACIKDRDLPRALAVLERMAHERVRPEQRTYAILIRAFASVGEAKDVDGLLRAAVGLDGVHPRLADFDARALQPPGKVPEDLVAEAVEAVAAYDEGMAVALVRDLKRKMPGLKIDAGLRLKMTTRAVGAAWR